MSSFNNSGAAACNFAKCMQPYLTEPYIKVYYLCHINVHMPAALHILQLSDGSYSIDIYVSIISMVIVIE